MVNELKDRLEQYKESNSEVDECDNVQSCDELFNKG